MRFVLVPVEVRIPIVLPVLDSWGRVADVTSTYITQVRYVLALQET